MLCEGSSKNSKLQNVFPLLNNINIIRMNDQYSIITSYDYSDPNPSLFFKSF